MMGRAKPPLAPTKRTPSPSMHTAGASRTLSPSEGLPRPLMNKGWASEALTPTAVMPAPQTHTAGAILSVSPMSGLPRPVTHTRATIRLSPITMVLAYPGRALGTLTPVIELPSPTNTGAAVHGLQSTSILPRPSQHAGTRWPLSPHHYVSRLCVEAGE